MARYFTNGEGKCRDETGMFQNQSSKRCACKDHWKHTESFQHTGSFMMRNKPLLRVSILQPALASSSNKSSVKFLKTNTHFRSLKPHELGIQKQPKTYLLLIRDSIAFYQRIQRLRIGIHSSSRDNPLQTNTNFTCYNIKQYSVDLSCKFN